MIDIDKQILYWRTSAEEDWTAGQFLLKGNRIRHGLFFVHLAVEKILKAHVCKTIRDLAPRTHNLTRLAETAKLALNDSQLDCLAELNQFNIEGRYPDSLMPVPSPREAKEYFLRAGEIYEWLTNQL